MTLGDNRRTFLSSLLLAGGSVAAFGESFRQDGRVEVSPGGDALFEHIQQQLAGILRAAKGRGVLSAEDAATGAAYMRICGVHARGLDIDQVASEVLARRVASGGQEALVNAAPDVTRLRAGLRRKGLVLSDRIVRDLSLADVGVRAAALEAVEQRRTSLACDRLAEALEAAAPQLARKQRFARRVAVADEWWCNFWVGQWTMYLSLAWYIASFQDPTLQEFLDAMWAGVVFYDTLYTQEC